MTTASWEVQITLDELEETNEKFRLILRNPVNTVLGDHDKATVQIVDYRDGKHRRAGYKMALDP